jgi:hypothetical protein
VFVHLLFIFRLPSDYSASDGHGRNQGAWSENRHHLRRNHNTMWPAPMLDLVRDAALLGR